MPVVASFALVNGIVYGPVESRRFGRSLGINLLPPNIKVCSFNCNYCECGWTTDLTDEATLAKYAWPTPEEIRQSFTERLQEAKTRGEFLDHVILSGNGEPTLHPEFFEVCRSILEVRNNLWPELPVGVLSNGANIGKPQVLGGLNILDERYMKLDAGSERMFLDMNSPVMDIGIWDILQGIKRLEDCILQSMFTHGRRDNTGEKDIQEWCDVVAQIRPKEVHLYSLDRTPADSKIVTVERPTLERIARTVEVHTGTKTKIF